MTMSAAVFKGSRRRRKQLLGAIHLFVGWAVPPVRLHVGASFQRLTGLLKVVVQKLKLAGDVVCIFGIASPGGDVDDIETGIDMGSRGSQLFNDQGGGLWLLRDGERVIGGTAGWRQAGQPQLDVLQGSAINVCASCAGDLRTPFTIRVPTRVTKPFRLSDLTVDTTKVEPCSVGAIRAAHSSRPSFKDFRVMRSDDSSHSSSRAYKSPLARAKEAVH